MVRAKTVYVCQNCGAESPKWIGKCYSCGAWNSFVEEVVVPKSKSSVTSAFDSREKTTPVSLSEIKVDELPRIDVGNKELNRVLGGGLVPGAMVLVGGEPGIGKSTLVLQMALNMQDSKILYVSGEESPQQIKIRGERVFRGPADHCYILSETSLERILTQVQNASPDILIIDSVQTLQTERVESAPGSVSQIRECTAGLLRFSKEKHLPVLLIGHINKEGSLAGPKVLEHMVDVVLQFEGDRNHMYRILRAIKNRFGSTDEIGIFEMQQAGLREVQNPSELLLAQHETAMSGVSVAAATEGMRPFLIEVQALTSTAAYGTPQRSSTGFDIRRLNMLLAVLEKRAGFKLSAKDVFLNIAGGLKVNDPGIDLAVVSSILSSNMDMALSPDVCLAGARRFTCLCHVQQRLRWYHAHSSYNRGGRYHANR